MSTFSNSQATETDKTLSHLAAILFFFQIVVLYTVDFTAVPLYKGVSLFLLLMSGSAPASRRHRTHDKCSQDTASSNAVCSCKVRLSAEPGWAGAENIHMITRTSWVTYLAF